MTPFKIYQKTKTGQYQPRRFGSRGLAIQSARDLALGLAQHWRGEQIQVYTCTKKDFPIMSSARERISSGSLISYDRIPNYVMRYEQKLECCMCYLDTSRENLYPFTLYLS